MIVVKSSVLTVAVRNVTHLDDLDMSKKFKGSFWISS